MDGYSFRHFRQDLLAGVIVGVVAIPLAMAFAIASGVKPEYGIYSSIIAGIVISLLGGSRFQISGPTGAFIPVLYAIVLQYGYENLLVAGFLAGVLLLLMGLLRLGALIQYIPRPVIIGFTSGIAVIIFSGQIANFLGLRGIEKHEAFWDNMKEIGTHLGTFNSYGILTALICLAILIATPKLLPKVPAPLLGLLVSSLVAAFVYPDKVATIGSSIGAIPSTLPQLHVPAVTWERIQDLLSAALVIAALGGIESLLSAVVADKMTGTRHNSNRELIGQGLGNMIAPLFGGIPVTGAIARTATNIKNGAVSRVSGLVHSAVVLSVLLLFAPYASNIPLAALAPILMMVAWNMSERREFAHVLKTRTWDSLVLVVTFLFTVFTSLTTAVEVGLVISVVLFVKQMSGVLTVSKALPDHNCPQIAIFKVEGPLFFGSAQAFERAIFKIIQHRPRVLLLKMNKSPFLDISGEAVLAELVKYIHGYGGIVLLSELKPLTRNMLIKTGLYEKIGEQHVFARTGLAIDHALTRIDCNACLGCTHYAFRECEHLSTTTTAV